MFSTSLGVMTTNAQIAPFGNWLACGSKARHKCNLTLFPGHRSRDDCLSQGRCMCVCVCVRTCILCVLCYNHLPAPTTGLILANCLLMSQLTPHPQPTCPQMSNWARKTSPWRQAAALCLRTSVEEVRIAHN